VPRELLYGILTMYWCQHKYRKSEQIVCIMNLRFARVWGATCEKRARSAGLARGPAVADRVHAGEEQGVTILLRDNDARRSVRIPRTAVPR
jgi:hypothetical protein